jgi:hypothetical protein
MGDSYRDVWRRYFLKRPDEESDPENLYIDRDFENKELTEVLEVELPALTMEAIYRAKSKGTLSTFDAILVDEGQDFIVPWWSLLQSVLREGGEMWLVADETQDIHERSKRWTDQGTPGAGYRGLWTRLDGSHRLPTAFLPHLRRYVEEYLDPESSDPPEVAQLPLAELDPWVVKWWQLDARADVVQACVNAVLAMPCIADPDILAFTDVTLLTTSNTIGLRCVDALSSNGFNVAHTFGRTKKERSDRKVDFFFGNSQIKATTIHSYKGWECRSLVVHIPKEPGAEGISQRALKTVYAGLTRLKAHPEGCYLTVVCEEPKLEAFGRTLPSFERYAPNLQHYPTYQRWDDYSQPPF